MWCGTGWEGGREDFILFLKMVPKAMFPMNVVVSVSYKMVVMQLELAMSQYQSVNVLVDILNPPWLPPLPFKSARFLFGRIFFFRLCSSVCTHFALNKHLLYPLCWRVPLAHIDRWYLWYRNLKTGKDEAELLTRSQVSKAPGCHHHHQNSEIQKSSRPTTGSAHHHGCNWTLCINQMWNMTGVWQTRH